MSPRSSEEQEVLNKKVLDGAEAILQSSSSLKDALERTDMLVDEFLKRPGDKELRENKKARIGELKRFVGGLPEDKQLPLNMIVKLLVSEVLRPSIWERKPREQIREDLRSNASENAEKNVSGMSSSVPSSNIAPSSPLTIATSVSVEAVTSKNQIREVPSELASDQFLPDSELPREFLPIVKVDLAPEVMKGSYELIKSAIMYKVLSRLSFFQRYNSKFERDIPPVFLLSPEFAEDFVMFVKTNILPHMMSSNAAAERFYRGIAESRDWTGVNTKAFWDKLSDEQTRKIFEQWEAAWERYKYENTDKLDEKKRPIKIDGVVQKTKKLPSGTTKAAYLSMRATFESRGYIMPRVDNREVDLFIWLMGSGLSLDDMDDEYEKARQIYEQEHDPRAWSDILRAGALRDTLLAVIDRRDARTGEFLVLLAYYNFPNLTIKFFIQDFVRSKSRNLDAIPYINWFANLPEVIEEGKDEDIRRIKMNFENRLRA